MIGDVHVKIWGSWHDSSSQMRKFDRPHEYKSCKEAYTLRHGMKILVITVGNNEGVTMDLDSMQQQPVSTLGQHWLSQFGRGLGVMLCLFCTPCCVCCSQMKMRIPAHATPMYYDGRYLMLLQLSSSGIKVLQLWDAHSQRLLHTLTFDKRHKFYWGFQLVDLPSPPSAAAAGAIATTTAVAGAAPSASLSSSAAFPSDGERKENAVDSSASSSSAAASSAAAITAGAVGAAAGVGSSSATTYLAYVSNFNKVKLIPFALLPAPRSMDEVEAADLPAAYRARPVAAAAALDAAASVARRQLYSHRICAHSHAARILAFLFDPSQGLLYTLGSDAKLKMFAVDAAAARRAGLQISPAQERQHALVEPRGIESGFLIRKYRHIQGTFKLGYPYVLKKISDKLLFYTADEGIFMLRL